MAAFAVIALLLGLLYMTSSRVSEERANPERQLLAQERAGEGLVAGVMKSVHAWRESVRESDSQLALQSLRIGRILLVGGWLYFVAAGAGASMGWGLFIFFMPMIGMLFFSSYHWEEAKGPWVTVAAGLVVSALGIALV